MPNKEIERKWLCTDPSVVAMLKQKATSTEYIEQRYLPSEAGTSSRVRYGIRGEECKAEHYAELTRKTGKGLVREETNIPLDIGLASTLLEYVDLDDPYFVVSKRRYAIPIEDNLILEMDVYSGSNSGLVHLEVEFPSLEEAMSFKTPEYFGDEVTEDKRHSNRSLSKNPFTRWDN